MSLESWVKEFYPITAEEAAEQGALAAAKHSLHKWRGALLENLMSHGLTFKEHLIKEDLGEDAWHEFDFEGDTCALCELNTNCETCPLVQAGFPGCNSMSSAYHSSYGGDPRLMIVELAATVRWLESQEQGEVA